MENIYKSKSMLLCGYGSLLLIALEIMSAFSDKLKIFSSIYGFIFMLLIAPISFILLLMKSKKLPKKKNGFMEALGIIFLFVIIELLVVVPLAMISSSIAPNVPQNEIIDVAQTNMPLVIILLLWQLLGEEAIKLSIFFLIYNGYNYIEEKKSRYWMSWTISSVLFGLLHLSTYGFNFLHCILVIGLSSVVYAFLWKATTKPSYLYAVHVTYDLVLVLLSLLII